ncbi:MAG: hypothetical protein HYT87_13835 [Nitrospirae bacterium]|nr:hypothetical protein [Nitrospirota bacterium]
MKNTGARIYTHLVAAALVASCGSASWNPTLGQFSLTPAGGGALISNTAWDHVVFASPERTRKFPLSLKTLGWVSFSSPSTRYAAWISPHASTLYLFDAESLTLTAIPSRPLQTTAVFSPDERWVLAYVDPVRLPADITIEGAVGFADVTLVQLETGDHRTFSIGENPNLVTFSQDGNYFVFATASRLVRWDVHELVEPNEMTSVDVPIRLTASSVILPTAMALSPDNQTGFLAVKGRSDLFIIEFDKPNVRIESLGSEPSGIFVAVDQTSARKFAVIQDKPGSNRWFRLNLDSFELVGFNTAVFPKTFRFSADGTSFLIVPPDSNSVLSRVTIRDGTETVATLVKNITDAAISANGEFGFALHNQQGSGTGDTQGVWKSRLAVSIINFDTPTQVATPLLVEKATTSAFLTPSGGGISLFLSGVPRAVHLPFNPGTPTTLQLPFVPETTTRLPDGQLVFLTSASPGAVGFVNPETGETRVVHGIELVGVLDP